MRDPLVTPYTLPPGTPRKPLVEALKDLAEKKPGVLLRQAETKSAPIQPVEEVIEILERDLADPDYPLAMRSLLLSPAWLWLTNDVGRVVVGAALREGGVWLTMREPDQPGLGDAEWDRPPEHPNPIYKNKRLYGRKSKDPFETQEQRDARHHAERTGEFFTEATASEEAEQPVLFFAPPLLSPEEIQAYVQVPEAPEITMSDIYDVLNCQGRWYIKGRELGFPCNRHIRDEEREEWMQKAHEFLVSQGYKPMP